MTGRSIPQQSNLGFKLQWIRHAVPKWLVLRLNVSNLVCKNRSWLPSKLILKCPLQTPTLRRESPHAKSKHILGLRYMTMAMAKPP